jgi:outer membrane protein TolC
VKIAYNSLPVWRLGLLTLAMAGHGFARAQVSLATVVDLAQRNSDAVKLASADEQKAEASLAQARDPYAPSLEFSSGLPSVPSVGFTGSPPSILTATVQELVFSVPQGQYIKGARAGLRAAALSLKDAREQVTLDASTAYIELDTVERELDAMRQQESEAGRLVKIEQDRSEAGVDPLSELLQAQLTAAQLKLSRLHLETRGQTLAEQLAVLTGLPAGSITPDHGSIPEIPAVKADEAPAPYAGIESAKMMAGARQRTARGDKYALLPQITFTAQYNRDTTLLNNADSYFARPLKSDNLSSGFSVLLPLFDLGLHSKARESAAEALRAEVEAEQAQHQNDIQIASLTGSLREMDALEEIASLKQQIAAEQLQSVLAQLELGNGQSGTAGGPPQISPKAEQLARIDERQKYADALEAGFELARTRLSLLRALGHMEDWLRELHGK